MNKSKFSLLILLVMILSISAVAAADDTSDIAVQAVDDDAIMDVASDDVVGANDTDVLADDGSTSPNFAELESSLDSSPVTLSSDYKRAEGDHDIQITTDVEIIGDNHKIDADKLGRIFYVNSGCTLTLTGVTLLNGNAEYGGAIYNNGGTVILNDCKFLNNTAQKSGGAVYNDQGTMSVTGSTFDGNDLTQRTTNGWGGAAIYSNKGTVTITGSNITNNLKDIVHRGGTGTYTGDLSSGAVTSKNGALTVIDSRFEKNSGSYGGAILSDGADAVLTVSGSTFADNFAFNGGAIECSDNRYTIIKSTFKGNDARGTGSAKTNNAHGGAIFASVENSDSVISECVFEDNSAAFGGAISSVNTNIIACNFTNNTARMEYSESFNGKANNAGGVGDAIYSTSKITIKDSNFTDNVNPRNKGVYAQNGEITGSSFTNTTLDLVNGPVTISDNTYDNDVGFDISTGNNPHIYFEVMIFLK